MIAVTATTRASWPRQRAAPPVWENTSSGPLRNRRRGLRRTARGRRNIRCSQGRVGSSPTLGTPPVLARRYAWFEPQIVHRPDRAGRRDESSVLVRYRAERQCRPRRMASAPTAMQPAPSSNRSPEFVPVFGRLVPSTSVPSEEFDAVLLSVSRLTSAAFTCAVGGGAAVAGATAVVVVVGGGGGGAAVAVAVADRCSACPSRARARPSRSATSPTRTRDECPAGGCRSGRTPRTVRPGCGSTAS